MFIFDIFNRETRRLRVVSVVMAAAVCVLLARLWFVQIVSAKQLEKTLQKQTYRTVDVPAPRGRILDRNGQVLAANVSRYDAVLVLEDLQAQFATEYTNVRTAWLQTHPAVSRLSKAQHNQCVLQADYNVVSNLGSQAGAALGQPLVFDPGKFMRFYTNYRYVPYILLTNLNPKQVAVFSEQFSGVPGLELDADPARSYPHKTNAAQLIGYVRREGDGEKYLTGDYEGKQGIEEVFDDELRGEPGTNLVQVNYQGYRQGEGALVPGQSGNDVYLTIDFNIQQAAEKALGEAEGGVRGAVVVMDVRNGDVLAMASSPSFDPNTFVNFVSSNDWERLNDKKTKPMENRATAEAYPPGSTFKIITAIACLETGVLNPDQIYQSAGYWQSGDHRIGDTAPAGAYNFERAFYLSCNTYFINFGMKAGLPKILEVAKRFHLGEKTGIASGHEVAGDVPAPSEIGTDIRQSSAPNVCIGQEVTITPIQAAVMISAVANGGTVYTPRIVSRVMSSATGEEKTVPQGRVKDYIRTSQHNLDVIRKAMLADTEYGSDPEGHNGSGFKAFHLPESKEPYLPGFHVGGKTGTAEMKSPGVKYYITWFDSYGPMDNPRYAVIVVVEHGGSGGGTCAPVARKVYQAIVKSEQMAMRK